MAQVNLGGTSGSFLMSVFAGEVIAQFERRTKLMQAIRVKNVGPGAISWRFPNISNGVAKYHSPGDSLISGSGYADGNSSMAGAAEKVIAMDKVLTASVLINDLEAKMSAYDARADLGNQLAAALATKLDDQLFRVISLAPTKNQAGSTIGVVSAPGGSQVVNIALSGSSSDGTKLLACLYEAQARLTSRNVPEDDRFVVLSPTAFRGLFATNAGAMVAGLEPLSQLFQGPATTGTLPMIAGFKILVSSAFTNTGSSATDHKIGTTVNNDYANNGADIYAGSGSPGKAGLASVAAFCFHRSAVGCVKSEDITVEANYMPEYLSNLVVAKVASGAGVLRYESAVAITDNALFT